MPSHPRAGPCALAASFVLLAAAAPARADELLDSLLQPHFGWTAFSGLTHTSNATRSPDGASDTIATAGLRVDYAHASRRLQVDARGSAWYETYLDETYDSDLVASAAGSLRYEFLPERFAWYVEDSYGQIARSTLAPATPGNRANVNFFATGPQFVLRFGPTSGLRLTGRYARSDFEDFTEVDDRRRRVDLAWYRNPSRSATISANASAERVEYALDGIPGYDVRQAYLRVETRRSRYGFAVDAGLAQLRQREREERAPLLRATAWRQLTATWNVNLQTGQDYRNSGDLFRDAVGDARVVNDVLVYVPPGVDPTFVRTVLADVTLDNRPLRYRYARLALDADGPRGEFGVDLGAARERYALAGQDLDRDSWTAGVRASRRLRPTVTARVRGGTYRRTFRVQQGSDETRYADAGVEWQLGRRLATSLVYRFERRDSDFDAFDYTDHVLYVGLRYAPPVPQRVAPAARDPSAVEPGRVPAAPGPVPDAGPPRPVVPTPVVPTPPPGAGMVPPTPPLPRTPPEPPGGP